MTIIEMVQALRAAAVRFVRLPIRNAAMCAEQCDNLADLLVELDPTYDEADAEVEVERVLVLSTAHVPAELREADSLDPTDGASMPRWSSHDYGFIVFLPDAESCGDPEWREDVTPWVLPVVDLAVRMGCCRIDFDCAAGVILSLQQYE